MYISNNWNSSMGFRKMDRAIPFPGRFLIAYSPRIIHQTAVVWAAIDAVPVSFPANQFDDFISFYPVLILCEWFGAILKVKGRMRLTDFNPKKKFIRGL
jgi:hypothetical protein